MKRRSCIVTTIASAFEMQDTDPLVSVVIPTHNRASILPRAVQSVLDQTYERLEIIVVDDGSSDETPSVLAELAATDNRIRILRNDLPSGAPAARNRGIREAQGDFVAGLDDDDEWLPTRIAKMVSAYDSNYSCITTDVLIDDGNRRRRWRKRGLITLGDLLYTNHVGNQVLVARERLLEVGCFDESLPSAQDYDLWVRLAARYGPIRNIKEPLQIIHMAHADRITTSHTQISGYLQFYWKHRHRMNRKQRRYQLYTIRRKAGRRMSFAKTLTRVPPDRWLKELKAILLERIHPSR